MRQGERAVSEKHKSTAEDPKPKVPKRLASFRRESRRLGLVGIRRSLEALNRLRLPGPSVLPVAGAVVGIYSGLGAGLFSAMIGFVSGFVFGLPKLIDLFHHNSQTVIELVDALETAKWHPEYAVIGLPVAGAALLLARFISPGGPRDPVKFRLRILAFLTLGALGLYYPLVGLTVINRVFGHVHELALALSHLPVWAYFLAPALGGLLVGRLLRDHPDTHGHGVPEVALAVKRNRPLPPEAGLLKLVASAVTIGSGGSAGREGPIVYGGAAFGSAVGRTLGFSRKELSILLASGAGAGIAASFNAPIGGAIFAMEIILREFELKVFSPIILASVTATMVARGVMNNEPLLPRLGYSMVSGWEVGSYVLLGLLCGLLAYWFVTLLHEVEHFFGGQYPGKLSAFLGRQSLVVRVAIGGVGVGLLAAVNPTVWGTASDFMSFAAAGKLTLGFLTVACAFKLIATALTIGSGGSGGTFFPATVIGAMGGGAFGEVLHLFFPTVTAPSGAYAMVGMAGCVAGLTRGPLTGMIMVYELSGSYSLILPLMICCTIGSALTHYLVERKQPKVITDADLLRDTPVRKLMIASAPVPAATRARALLDLVVAAEVGALTVLDGAGRIYGVVQLDDLREVWRDEELNQVLVASDVARKTSTLGAEMDLATALETMDHEDVDALPVVDRDRSVAPYGIVTRSMIRRHLYTQHASQREASHEDEPVGTTEVEA
jgi:CIC family chloride channel protein